VRSSNPADIGIGGEATSVRPYPLVRRVFEARPAGKACEDDRRHGNRHDHGRFEWSIV
jgi:hypothetical protein